MNDGFIQIKDLFGEDRVMKAGGKILHPYHVLLGEFAKNTGYDIAFLGRKLQGLDVATLRYIESVCRQESARGKSWKHQFDIEVKKIWNWNKPS